MAQNSYKRKEQGKKESFRLSMPKFLNFIKDKRFHLAVGFLLLFSSVFFTIAFVSYLFTGKADQSVIESVRAGTLRETGLEAENWLGLSGAMIAHTFIFQWFGLAAFLFLPVLFLIGYRILFTKAFVKLTTALVVCAFFLFWISIALGYYVRVSSEPSSMNFLSGAIGYEMATLFDSLMGWGTLLFLVFSLLVFAIYMFNITNVIGWGKTPEDDAATGYDEDSDFAMEAGEMREAIQEEDSEAPEEEAEDDDPVALELEEIPEEDTSPEPETEAEDPEEDALQLDIRETKKEEEQKAPESDLSLTVEDTRETEEENDPLGKVENYDPTLDLPSYKYPTLDLLEDRPESKGQVTKEELEANKDRIVDTLGNYKIGISSIKATIGPTVTLYELVPEAGIRISKIKNLEDDIALSLSALGIRIIAPMPGKGTIGIEVPNKNREMVSIRSLFSSEKFLKSDMDLPVAIGKTISNEGYMFDLAKMPHLLIAGATGQGKSVGLNTLLTSLIYKKHPSQLKLVLVDPKKVELSLFSKLENHFLARLPDAEESIITDTKKVVNTLNSLCIEMDNRYALLKEAGCRNLKEYNKKFVERRLNPEKGHYFMPYIVLVIDELADLMMTAGKEVETPIARLAQLARAIGIHLVVATQRPSVNVITGIIKANFPARLSFKVTSKVDSRTILDMGGADQLIGMGDMLLSKGSSELIRLQCAFVDTHEVENACAFIGDQRGYGSAYLLPEYVGEESGSGEVDLSERDELFEEAARVIVVHQQGSTSLLQRKMKLGYNRAGRIIDQLEAAGVVGPFEGSKAREVLIPDEHSLEQLLSGMDSRA